MPQASHFTMTLDLAVQDRCAVLEAAATHLTRIGTVASVEAARAHLADDVPKALSVLIGLRNRLAVALNWLWIYVSGPRSARLITQRDPAGSREPR